LKGKCFSHLTRTSSRYTQYSARPWTSYRVAL